MKSEYQVRTTRQVVAAMTRDKYTPTEIARHLGISRQAVHHHLDRLELEQLRAERAAR
ncbi:MAG: ArsR family transcriptional regulator [Armatimonadetes bacterium]|nr:MAG: ArsR family transcriptional regulator [Armatimonadota bacterium]